MDKLSSRDKSVLAGLYLSKFDVDGMDTLGFDSFTEAFNVIGLALDVRPASIKNYRDEFDPLFPNSRKGWHKRPMRDYCKAIYDSFNHLPIDTFTQLLKEFIYKNHAVDVLLEEVSKKEEGEEQSFAKRLITGQAAEQYFRSKFRGIPIFSECAIEDTTKLGCGFDFRLVASNEYYGVEVKGLNEANGSVMLTDKEHRVATLLRSRYFLFVVKNFRDTPSHDMFRDPLSGPLTFKRLAIEKVSVNWVTNI